VTKDEKKTLKAKLKSDWEAASAQDREHSSPKRKLLEQITWSRLHLFNEYEIDVFALTPEPDEKWPVTALEATRRMLDLLNVPNEFLDAKAAIEAKKKEERKEKK
jgi:hypothetical protein